VLQILDNIRRAEVSNVSKEIKIETKIDMRDEDKENKIEKQD
jgi:hypothetical protein